MAQVTTSHYKIYNYWRDKIIHQDGQVTTDGNGCLEDEVVVEEHYYPRCWGCGLPVVRDSKIDEWVAKQCLDEDEESNLKRIWNSKETRNKLNRCHIIPGSLGGEDVPSNLFLMCSECHHLSPDTKYPSMFFKWVLERRKQMVFGTFHPNYILKKVDELLVRDYGVTVIDLLERIHKLGGDSKLSNLQEFMHDRIGLHGTKIAESSAMVAVEKWLMSIYMNLALEG